MAYRVNVIATNTSLGFYTLLFANFISHEKTKDPRGIGHPWEIALEIALAPHNAKNIADSPYIEFETEQDYLLFALKFG